MDDLTILGKFKSVKALKEAYDNLQREFTKKCQKIGLLFAHSIFLLYFCRLFGELCQVDRIGLCKRFHNVSNKQPFSCHRRNSSATKNEQNLTLITNFKSFSFYEEINFICYCIIG